MDFPSQIPHKTYISFGYTHTTGKSMTSDSQLVECLCVYTCLSVCGSFPLPTRTRVIWDSGPTLLQDDLSLTDTTVASAKIAFPNKPAVG